MFIKQFQLQAKKNGLSPITILSENQRLNNSFNYKIKQIQFAFLVLSYVQKKSCDKKVSCFLYLYIYISKLFKDILIFQKHTFFQRYSFPTLVLYFHFFLRISFPPK